jgi:hypothetical protein
MNDEILNILLPQITQMGFGAIILFAIMRWLINIERELNEISRMLDEISGDARDLNKSINNLTDSINTFNKRFRYG